MPKKKHNQPTARKAPLPAPTHDDTHTVYVPAIFDSYGFECTPTDEKIIATVLHDIAHLLVAHLDHLKEAANEAGEGEIVAKLEVVLPFGTSEPVVGTKIGFTCKKIVDQRETKLEDPNQSQLALKGEQE